MNNTPAVVVELARRADGVPLSWFVAPDHVTIVFVDGRKLTFEKESEIDQEQTLETEETSVKKPTRRTNAK